MTSILCKFSANNVAPPQSSKCQALSHMLSLYSLNADNCCNTGCPRKKCNPISMSYYSKSIKPIEKFHIPKFRYISCSHLSKYAAQKAYIDFEILRKY